MKTTQPLAAPSFAAVMSPRGSKRSYTDRNFTLLSMLPTVLVMVIIFGLPLLFSLYLSTRGWTPERSLSGGAFVGFENFAYLLSEKAFRDSLLLTNLMTICCVTLEVTLGLGIALALNRELPLISTARTVLIMPMMMTPLVAALCWKLLLDPQYGLVNYMLGTQNVWLGDPVMARISVGLVNVWQNTPYVALLLLAGLRSIPTDPYEAASIDGANAWQRFRYITLPALQPTLLVAILLRTIFEFRTFENVYVLTGGGPGGATNVLSIYTYMLTFVQFDFTLGAAASWITLIASFALCMVPIVVFRFIGRKER
jgi:multiple sugar transport system permease protein